MLKEPKTWVLIHPEFELTSEETHTLQSAVDRLLQGVPLPHILGEWEFYGRSFIVTPDVLIPRPETELLVERALSLTAKLTPNPHCRYRHRLRRDRSHPGGGTPSSQGYRRRHLPTCTDDRPPECPKAPTKRDPASFKPTCCSPFPLSFDLICANLPYIPTRKLKNLTVAQWEPWLALDGGSSGLDLIEKLLRQARSRLAPSGAILLEIESSLGSQSFALAKCIFPGAEIHLHQDLAGKDRLIEIKSA